MLNSTWGNHSYALILWEATDAIVPADGWGALIRSDPQLSHRRLAESSARGLRSPFLSSTWAAMAWERKRLIR